jgi:hypothetical protein
MYFYYNYCNIQDIERGKILPDFRVADHAWFKLIEECQASREWGVICVKRRRVGASWKEAGDVLHDSMFNSFYHVGMNSMSEKDSKELFKKVKFIYSNLPDFLRATSRAGNSSMSMDFSFYAKDKSGNRIKRGTQSYITVVSPTPSAFEGMMLNKWICDEAGKVDRLNQLWSFTVPCLMSGARRSGCPVLFGTSGEIDRAGKGLKYMWDNADAYKLKQFFFAGWMGLMHDKYGNDLVEDSIRWIIYERYRMRNLSMKEVNDFIQQFPLNIDEAFKQASEGGLGDPVAIERQLGKLVENPPKAVTGKFVMLSTGEIEWVPSKLGKAIIYEHPEPNLANQYIGGCDPADHDDVFEEASDLSTYIIKKQKGSSSPYIVFEYTDRPAKLNEYYRQTLYALIYYNKAKLLIENNRYRMISWFEDNEHKNLLQATPQGVMRFFSTKMSNNIGVRMNKDVKDYMEGLIEEYVDYYCDLIPSRELLMEFKEYGIKNTDRAMAFGIALIFLKEDKTHVRLSSEDNPAIPSFSYRRINGRIVRYNPRTQTQEKV